MLSQFQVVLFSTGFSDAHTLLKMIDLTGRASWISLFETLLLCTGACIQGSAKPKYSLHQHGTKARRLAHARLRAAISFLFYFFCIDEMITNSIEVLSWC